MVRYAGGVKARHLLLGTVSVWVTALLLNLAAYVATTVALPRLVRAVLGDRGGTPGRQGAGLIAAVLFAVSPDAIFGTGLSTPLSGFLETVVADINEAGVRETVASMGPGNVARKVDVTQPAEVEAMVAEAVKSFGKLDVVYANAGIDQSNVDHEGGGRLLLLPDAAGRPVVLPGGWQWPRRRRDLPVSREVASVGLSRRDRRHR